MNPQKGNNAGVGSFETIRLYYQIGTRPTDRRIRAVKKPLVQIIIYTYIVSFKSIFYDYSMYIIAKTIRTLLIFK